MVALSKVGAVEEMGLRPHMLGELCLVVAGFESGRGLLRSLKGAGFADDWVDLLDVRQQTIWTACELNSHCCTNASDWLESHLERERREMRNVGARRQGPLQRVWLRKERRKGLAEQAFGRPAEEHRRVRRHCFDSRTWTLLQ